MTQSSPKKSETPEGGNSFTAIAGIVLGLATCAYIGIVLFPALAPPGQDPFPPCLSTNKFFKFTTQGSVPAIDTFLCVVLPFFIDATASPFAAWNWAEMLLTLLPVGVHAMEASTTSLRAFWVLLVPALVAGLGQMIGISIAFPLIGLPCYALSGAARLAARETSVAVAWGIVVISLVFLIPLTMFFVFPQASDPWLKTFAIFQFTPPLMFLALLPFALCCKEAAAGYRGRAKAHTLLLGLFTLYAGVCIVSHVLATAHLGVQSGWSWPTLVGMANGAWADMKVRFLLVDHAVCIVAVGLMVLLDGGVSGLLLTAVLSPFLSVGGAVCLFYARPHQLWLMKGTQEDKPGNKSGRKQD